MGRDEAGEAWERWTTVLGELDERLRGPGFPTDERGRAEGVRHLARLSVLALHEELELADPLRPRLHRYELPWSQWGAPNPDNVYQRCSIDPAGTYVLRGQVEGVHEALFSVVEGDMHLDEHGVFSEVALSDLDLDDRGRLALHIGPDPAGPNHLPTGPGARLLLIRQYLYDWAAEPVASFTVERVDVVADPPPPPTPAEVAAALDRAATWVERSLSYWAEYVDASRQLLEPNTFTPPSTPSGGAPSIAYGGGCWDLAPGEALLIEHDLPDAHYWNWSIHQLHWFDSGDWDRRCTSCNGHQAHVDPDGRVRVVLAGEDPGVPNWLDTQARPVGMAVYRYVGARSTPVPTARVVPLDGLRARLPSEHPVVGVGARRDRRRERSLAAQRRWS